MKTLESLETSAAMMRSAFVLACNDVRQEFAETNDLARRALISAQDTMTLIPEQLESVDRRLTETSENLRTVVAVVSVVAIVAIFIAVYAYAISDVSE